MRNVFFIFIASLLLSFSCADKNENLNIKGHIFIDGNTTKAFLIATNDFNGFGFPIERYRIKITEDEDNYEIYFLFFIIDDWETATWGAQDSGNEVYYCISKKTFEIQKRILYL